MMGYPTGDDPATGERLVVVELLDETVKPDSMYGDLISWGGESGIGRVYATTRCGEPMVEAGELAYGLDDAELFAREILSAVAWHRARLAGGGR